MKITDYGVWFQDLDTYEFTKMPANKRAHNHGVIYFNGRSVGFCDIIGHYVHIRSLVEMGFRINLESPGINDKNIWWSFSPEYIPAESDFEELR